MHFTPSEEFALPLALMRQQLATADLLPSAYARYRPLLADALCFFLERLPRRRLERLLAEQTRLPTAASTAERVVAVLHHAPALHKLGQVVARDRRLTSSFRQRLQQLESLDPRASLPEIKPLLQRELPKWRRAGIQLGPALLAEGSVAVIIPFVWRGQAGVFKLLKSDIRHKLADDLEILGQLGEFLDSDCENYHLPPLDYGETFDTIRDLLLHEVRLEEEQKHLSEAAKMYAHLPMVTVPALLPFCSSRLTAMQRIPGVKIAESSPAGAHMRMALARAVSQALVVEPLFSQQSAPLFHADPHAGNLLRTPENKLAILDWSLTGRLSKSARVELVQLLLGALTLDGAKMAKAIEHLSHRPPGAALIDVLEQHLQKLGWGTLPGFGWLTRLLDELVVRAGVRFDSDLLLFRKSLLTLEGVLADLLESDVATACRILDEALLAGLLQHSSREWAQRLISPLLSRHFRTHLATTDLLECFWSAPLTAARWWNLQLAESVNRGRTRN